MPTVSIVSVVEAVKGGTPLIEAIPEGADPKLWQRLVDNFVPPSKVKKQSRRSKARRRSTPNKRTNYAAQVIARNKATSELVVRVNGQEDPAAASLTDDFITIHRPEGTTRVTRAGKMTFEKVTK